MFKKYLPLAIFFTLSYAASAQKAPPTRHQKWELGLQAGLTQAQTDLNNFGVDENNLGGGLLLRYHLDDNVAVRGNFFYGEISGDDRNYTSRIDRGFRFSAPLVETSVVFEMDLLGKKRWKNDGSLRRLLSPYIFGGVGYSFSKPSTDYNEVNNINLRAVIDEDKLSVKSGRPVLPLGFGAKLDVSENWVVGLEAGIRVLFDDYIDGVSKSGNARKNDTYTFIAVTTSYRFSYISDRDHDGVPDAEDACPDKKGNQSTKGCPDTDGDGISDNIDNCPDQKGLAATGGCPDSDGDGISDKSDQCPNEKGSVATGGCPDKDKDGIVDSKDACPDVFGVAKLGGCPDTDGDGIKDTEDQCPDVAGPMDNNGCPLNDRDRDGVLDANDRCPDIAGSAAFSGCPDTDGDGVGDHLDKCINEKGPASSFGCPALSDADKKVLVDAIYGVQFEPAKSVLKASSYPILDQVVSVMNKYPAYQLTISGHTDSDGTEASNQKLSEARAKACYDYLLGKGIIATRMKNMGFGESKPVAENTTKEGKMKNRRVAFDVEMK